MFSPAPHVPGARSGEGRRPAGLSASLYAARPVRRGATAGSGAAARGRYSPRAHLAARPRRRASPRRPGLARRPPHPGADRRAAPPPPCAAPLRLGVAGPAPVRGAARRTSGAGAEGERRRRPAARCGAGRSRSDGEGMAAMSSLEAVRRKIRSLQEQADAAEERAGRLQREVDQERALREEVGPRASQGRGQPLPGAAVPAGGGHGTAGAAQLSSA